MAAVAVVDVVGVQRGPDGDQDGRRLVAALAPVAIVVSNGRGDENSDSRFSPYILGEWRPASMMTRLVRIEIAELALVPYFTFSLTSSLSSLLSLLLKVSIEVYNRYKGLKSIAYRIFVVLVVREGDLVSLP